MSISNQYNPDYSVHPGAILEETLEARGLSKKDIADRCGISPKHLNQILHEKATCAIEKTVPNENSKKHWSNAVSISFFNAGVTWR
jgi:transcriptional regulator with XRE-family HTH domain